MWSGTALLDNLADLLHAVGVTSILTKDQARRTISSAGSVELPEVRPGTPAGRRDPGLRAVQGTIQRICRIGSGSISASSWS